MTKKISLVIVLVVGVFWLGSTFAFDYPTKAAAVENLTDDFRPVFSDAGIEQAQADIAVINEFAAEFQSKAVPALAQQLDLTPEQLVGALSQQFPAVGAGIQELPTSLPYFNDLVAGLSAQQANFHGADAIPTQDLPAQTVHWSFVAIGVLAIGLALTGLLRPARSGMALALSAVVGLAVIAVSLVLSVPAKAKAVDDMTAALRPIFTTQGAEQTRAYLTTVRDMNGQLSAETLPALAGMLRVTPEQLAGSLGQNFPAVAGGLQAMPEILSRFDGLVSGIENNVGNFQLASSIPLQSSDTTALETQLAAPAGVMALAGIAGIGMAWAGRRRHEDVPATASAAAGQVRLPTPRPVPVADQPAVAGTRTPDRLAE